MKKVFGKYCLAAMFTLAFSLHAVAADLPEIEKSGTLKVATEDDYAPFNFMKDGKSEGFNKDMLDELRKYENSISTKVFYPGRGCSPPSLPDNTIWR